MGLVDRLFGRSDESPEATHICRTCEATFETSRVACDRCGGNVEPIEG
jgi:rRNA maturation endonuclease Nob1